MSQTKILSDTPAGNGPARDDKTRVMTVRPVPRVSISADSTPPVSAGRFDLGPELARGGTAVVYAGRDRDLDRDVAVKVLLPEYAGRADLVQRFREEANVMARLQHPGIPPVHAAGWLADGRPFIALKLIRGRTLHQLLRESPKDSVALYLPAFEQVCQALGFAHSQGVIHRDLKPGNFMIGAFGEAQVMDWGLAKVLGQPDDTIPVGDFSSRPRGGGGDHATEVGCRLGTPAYMPPEQARGDVARVDRRADVFALGGILTEILTGKPPCPGDSTSSDGSFVEVSLPDTIARLRTCGADPGLVALAERCLQPEPDARPNDAGELAKAVANYRTSMDARLRKAERLSAAADEQRKKHAAQVALALTLAGVVAAGGAVAWWIEHRDRTRAAVAAARDREAAVAVATTRHKITNELDRAEAGLRAKDWVGADAALARAEGLFQSTGEWNDLRERHSRLKADRKMVRAMEAASRRGRVWVDDRFDTAGACRAYAAAFHEFGIPIGDPDAAGKMLGSVIGSSLQSGLETWLGFDPSQPHLAGILDRLDPHPVRTALRGHSRNKDVAALAKLAELADPADLTPALAVLLATEARLTPVKAVALLETVWRAHPDDVLLALEISNYLSDMPGRQKDAIGYLRAAVAAHPGNAAAWNNLATHLFGTGYPDQAVDCLRRCLAIDPDHQYARMNLGDALLELEQTVEAEKELRAAAAGDPKDPLPLLRLVKLWSGSGRTDEAKATAAQLAQLADQATKNTRNSNDTLYGLGTILLEYKYFAGAERVLRVAVSRRPDWPEANINLGFAIQRQGRYDEAVPFIRKGHEAGSRKPDWGYPSAKWLADAEKLAKEKR